MRKQTHTIKERIEMTKLSDAIDCAVTSGWENTVSNLPWDINLDDISHNDRNEFIEDVLKWACQFFKEDGYELTDSRKKKIFSLIEEKV